MVFNSDDTSEIKLPGGRKIASRESAMRLGKFAGIGAGVFGLFNYIPLVEARLYNLKATGVEVIAVGALALGLNKKYIQSRAVNIGGAVAMVAGAGLFLTGDNAGFMVDENRIQPTTTPTSIESDDTTGSTFSTTSPEGDILTFRLPDVISEYGCQEQPVLVVGQGEGPEVLLQRDQPQLDQTQRANVLQAANELREFVPAPGAQVDLVCP